MRTTTLVTSYISAALFMALGARALMSWLRERDARAGHLAFATLFYAANSLMSAVSATVWNTAAGHSAPKWFSVISGSIGYIAIFAFLLFLFDFVKVPAIAPILFGLITVGLIVLAIIERTVIHIDPVSHKIDKLSGTPIDITAYINGVILYYAIVLGILWVSFGLYGLRVRGLARFRMLSISAGFLLLFIVFGLIPRLIHKGATLQGPFITTLQYTVLASAPLLFVGFTPPKFISKRIS